MMIMSEPADTETLARRFHVHARGLLLMSDDGLVELRNNVIYISGLNPLTREKELRAEFSKYGNIEKCELIIDPFLGILKFFLFLLIIQEESRGFAFITMSDESEGTVFLAFS